MNSIYSYLAIPLLPLIASFCVGILGRKLPELFASSMTISSVFIAFLLSCLTLNETLNGLVLNECSLKNDNNNNNTTINQWSWLKDGEVIKIHIFTAFIAES